MIVTSWICRAGWEGEVGSKVPYPPVGSRNNIPLPNLFRSSRTSSVRSLSLSGEDFAGGELGLSVEDLREGLAEQDTTCGLEHQVKVDEFQAFITILSMAEASSPGSVSSRRKASGEDALNSKCCRAVLRESRIRRTAQRKFCSAASGCPFRDAPRDFANLQIWSCEIPSPLTVKTHDEQVSGEMRERKISTAAAAAQDTTEAPALDSLQLFPTQM